MMKADPNTRTSRMAAAFRYVVFVALVTGGAFVVLEWSIRIAWPQTSTITGLDDRPISVRDSLLLHRYRPHNRVVHTGPEFTVEYEINGDGLRDAATSETPTPPPSSTTILLLGDSFTFGQGAGYEEIWPTVFERELLARGLEVDIINAGIQGYSTREEVLFLEQLHARFEPDIVLLAFLPNDLYANSGAEAHADSAALAAQSQGRSRLRSGLHSVMLLQRILASFDRMYVRLYLLTPWTQYYQLPPTHAFQEKIGITKTLLQRANAFCQEQGCEFAVLSVPQQFQVLAQAGGFRDPQIDVHLIERTLAPFAHAANIPWISAMEPLVEHYRANGEALFYRVDGHLNARGHRVVAWTLIEHFLERFATKPITRTDTAAERRNVNAARSTTSAANAAGTP